MRPNASSEQQLSPVPSPVTARPPEQLDGWAQPSSQSLYVVPPKPGADFRASIRGHILELADPNSQYVLAPTPDDLLVASLAAELAWSTRAFLRAHGLPEEVSVAANWRMYDELPGPNEIALTVTMSEHAEPSSAELARLFEGGLGSRLLIHPRVHISLEGASR